MAWGKNGTPDTLTGTADELNITDLTSTIFNTALMHIFPSGSTGHRKRFGSGSIDTGSNYAERVSLNGASHATYVSQDRHTGDGQSAGDRFQVEYGINIATEEKLFIYFDVNATVSGAGTAPAREQYVAKWVNTSNQYDQRRSYNALGGSMNTDSNLSALGADITPAAGSSAFDSLSNVQVGSRAEITDTRKMYNLNPVSQADTITKDTQAIIQHGTAGYGSPDTFSSFTVGNNSNRALIVATGAYNAGPDIISVKFNGTESFTHITRETRGGYKVELWYLINPTVTTADVVIEWGTQSGFGGAGAGQMGAIAYSFYNVAQTSSIGTPVTKDESSASTSPFINITPATAGSMIIDSWFNGAGTTVTNALTDGMDIICGGVDRNMASQYNLTPTIGSANSMSRTSGNDGYTQIAVEVKASTSLVNTWSEEGT
jgi:hypothetical protein